MSKKNDGAGLNSRLIRRPIQRWAPLFILPVFAAFCIGFVWPFLQGIYLSFCTFNIPKDAKWVGLTNYSKIWTDVSFWNAFKNTAFFAVVSILLINVLAFFIAYALTQKMRGSNLFRTVFFMPKLNCSLTISKLVWLLLTFVSAAAYCCWAFSASNHRLSIVLYSSFCLLAKSNWFVLYCNRAFCTLLLFCRLSKMGILRLMPIILFHPYFICCAQLLVLALLVVLVLEADRLMVG